jgi:glycosyltransferase 2 family protein
MSVEQRSEQGVEEHRGQRVDEQRGQGVYEQLGQRVDGQRLGEHNGRRASSEAPEGLGGALRRGRLGLAGRGWRPLLVNLAVLLVTLVFSYVALSHIRLAEAWRGLRTSDYWWLLPALGAFGLGNVARALRWRSLFPPGRRPPPATTLNAMMIGYLYNNLLPARAGEPARVLVLTQRSSSPPVEITGTVVLERLYDVVGILAIFFVAQPWLPHVSWFRTAAIVAIALAVAIAVVSALFAIYGDRPLRPWLRPLRRWSAFTEDRLERMLAELVHGLSGLRKRGVASAALLWTIIAWLCSSLCAYLVMLAFHLQLPFAAAVLVMVAIGLSMMLPSPPAAVGVFEGATLIALSAYHVPHSVALPYALVLHLVNFVPFVVVGLVLLHYNSRHPRSASYRQAAVPSSELLVDGSA